MNSTSAVGAFPPPEGITPNFTHPKSNGSQIIFAGIILPVVMLPFLGVRLYAKYSLLKKFHYDDCMSFLHRSRKNNYANLRIRHDNYCRGRPFCPSLLSPQAANQYCPHSHSRWDFVFCRCFVSFCFSRLCLFILNDIPETRNGSGNHIWDLTLSKFATYFFVSSNALYTWCPHRSKI